MAAGSSYVSAAGSAGPLRRPAPDAGAWLAELAASPLIVVLRARHASEYAPVMEALLEGGVRHVELTLSTAGVLEALGDLVRQYGADARIGVGTVTDAVSAGTLIGAGAGFLVTPVMSVEVVATATAAGIPVVPGGLTPTELYAGWQAGAPAVKVFPASLVGPGYVSQLRGPFPDIQVIPSGGIGTEEADAWLRAGALAVGMGGPLVQDAFAGGSLAGLKERSRKLVAAVAAARGSGTGQ
ncbi:bifunctional 4-hydroxy-2-oxoglutarate aldolase/2-dehydro-3-deoxy-phosphogluconate aldolase [Arthrobacter sp. zg-Y859]|uniref:Bifunctional 4-hydroxy-2-oxoglutarate aldolase/2-dehydro-3-deoxy-phosphogluconate aldolase n=1 Tax=Arthrobacter jinronghuae TaxID=2964609 RepID=A0ABT1NNL3_9MICC|nr:bifunctional 4-hydroxy-2-oxoglutarate aldolase/2-dehydro-3-deoxy-phosphogluconate aldolase [Arthrobacter jinronghuae]MCQ1949313.1 bifunctional 4-hydroxy-2-oxoglutarate aldolase/2-dehydro-3-deoxy-phosphogluconate aldolase [Arthrobacter jinronghuae]UWX77906.1 bifunctional 4-hydroxy-2-oxoglutarate aldolase/2-dehydro-3-deoxy-phosphogluconate aldolase [Arthrobacter jinronghuae]